MIRIADVDQYGTGILYPDPDLLFHKVLNPDPEALSTTKLPKIFGIFFDTGICIIFNSHYKIPISVPFMRNLLKVEKRTSVKMFL